MNTVPDSNTGKLLFLLKKIHVRPIHMIIPICLGLLAAVFEGMGMGLLIPLAQGFLQKNFSFVIEAPYIGPLMRQLPTWMLTNDRMLFLVLFVGFLLLYVLRCVLRFLSVASMAYFAERMVHHLRKMLFARYLSFGKLYFDTTNVGHHSAVIMDFARKSLQPLITLDKLINALFALAAYLVVMLFISWKLTLIAIPLFFLLHLSVKVFVLRLRKLSHDSSERGLEMNKKAIEILSTTPLVKAYRMERLEQRRYTEISDRKARLEYRASLYLFIVQPIQEIITLLVASGIFFGALYLFGREQIASTPALVVFFYTVVNATSKFSTVSGFRGTLAHTTGPLDAVLTVFDDAGKYFVRDGTDVLQCLGEKIECRNLTFHYTDRNVLTDVSFTIPKGKMTALVGPSGAGKSTIIHLLMRYYDCPPDSIFLDGKDIRSFTLDSYLSHVAIVSQETFLFHDSLRNNILYGLEGVSDAALKHAVERARLTEFVGRLPAGLGTLIGDRGVKLSGGEKQRVSIARALLKGAEVLILDEATSSLDSQTEKMIQEAIDEAVTGRTAIVIAHRLSTIRNADNIVVLKDGRVEEQGTLDALLARNGLFSRLWEEQKF